MGMGVSLVRWKVLNPVRLICIPGGAGMRSGEGTGSMGISVGSNESKDGLSLESSQFQARASSISEPGSIYCCQYDTEGTTKSLQFR
jgi:hypothetical protein